MHDTEDSYSLKKFVKKCKEDAPSKDISASKYKDKQEQSSILCLLMHLK